MEITVAQVRELRERTGASIMSCRKALAEAKGNMQLAIGNLRDWWEPMDQARQQEMGARANPVAFIDSYLDTNHEARWALEENWRQVQEAIHHLDSTAEHAFLLIDILLRPLSHEMCALVRRSALGALKEDMQEFAVPALIYAVEVDPRHISKGARDELINLLKEVTGEGFVFNKLEKYKEWSRHKGLVSIDEAYVQHHNIDKSTIYGGWLRRRTYEEGRLDEQLVRASSEGDLSSVRRLLKDGADVNAWRGGNTALIAAAKSGHTEVVRVLIENGADASIKSDIEGTTALMSLAGGWKDEEIAIVIFLADHNAGINERNEKGWTALMVAAQGGPVWMTKALLEKGADVNARNNLGFTPLMVVACAVREYVEIAKVLIEHGANVDARNSEGNTALMMAAEMGHREIVRLLVESGANIDAQNHSRQPVLRFAKGAIRSDLIAARRSRPRRDVALGGVSPPKVNATETTREVSGPRSKDPGAPAPPPEAEERVATRGPYGASDQMGPAIRCSVCSARIPQRDSVCPSCGSDNQAKRPVAERALPPAEVDVIRTVPEVSGVGSKQRGASTAPLLEEQAHLATKDPYMAGGPMGRPTRCKACLACYPETDSVCPSCGSDGQAKRPVAGRAPPSNSEVACVAGGTRISLPDGKQVQVESVRAGQSVLGYHDGHGRVVSARVMRVASHDPAFVVRLTTDKGELVVTPRHRVLTEHGWTSVRDLIVGEKISACVPAVYGLGHARVDSITPVKEPRPLYNLYVEDACTYVANGLITHSYVVLPNLRTMLNRLHVALAGATRTRTAGVVLCRDFAGRNHPTTTRS